MISISRRVSDIPAGPVTFRSSHSKFISRSGAAVKSPRVMATPDRLTARPPSRCATQRSSPSFQVAIAWSSVDFPALFGPARTTESARSNDCSRKRLKFLSVRRRIIDCPRLVCARKRYSSIGSFQKRPGRPRPRSFATDTAASVSRAMGKPGEASGLTVVQGCATTRRRAGAVSPPTSQEQSEYQNPRRRRAYPRARIAARTAAGEPAD